LQQHAIWAIRTLDDRPSIFIRNTPILSSERMLYKGFATRVKLKKNLVVGLKELDAKTN
jgi:hypothetical protein